MMPLTELSKYDR